MTAVLKTVGLSRNFGSIAANSDVHLAIEQGARHALIGPNGAGKTTFINLLSGVLRASAGEIYLDGQRVTRTPQHERVLLGMTRTFQVTNLFPGLNVLESVVMAVCVRDGRGDAWWRPVAAERAAVEEARGILATLRLSDCADVVVRHLPYGKQRLLEIALALATRPRLLLLDEPAAGIPSGESAELFGVIARLPRDVTVVFVEHDMNLVFRFAESITVLVGGSVFLEGTPERIAADPGVREVYLGRDLDE